MSVWVIFEITEHHDPDRDPDLPPVPDDVRLYDAVHGAREEMEEIAHMLNGMNPSAEAWQSEDGTRGYWPKTTTYFEARQILPIPEDYTL